MGDQVEQQLSSAEGPEKKEHEISQELLDSTTNTNKTWILCSRCGSKILRPSLGQLHILEFKLPSMSPKCRNESGEFKEEIVTKFWQVHDMMTFENIGFTNTLNNMKYLICADCEIGPIGFQNLSDIKKLYIAIDRVSHDV